MPTPSTPTVSRRCSGGDVGAGRQDQSGRRRGHEPQHGDPCHQRSRRGRRANRSPTGGGDKPAIDKQPGLLSALDELVHPSTRGNPMSLARWTSKSTYELAEELVRQGYAVSAELVRRLLSAGVLTPGRRPSKRRAPRAPTATPSSTTTMRPPWHSSVTKGVGNSCAALPRLTDAGRGAQPGARSWTLPGSSRRHSGRPGGPR
jgi:hypothetical protein